MDGLDELGDLFRVSVSLAFFPGRVPQTPPLRPGD